MANIFDFGYNGVYQKVRRAPSDKFHVRYRPNSEVLSLEQGMDAVSLGVFETARQLNRKVAVLYSGGFDSELILLNFLKLGLTDFSVFHLVYDDGVNRYDTEYAERFCKAHSLQLNKLNYPAHNWYTSSDCSDFCIENNISYVTMTQVVRAIGDLNKNSYYPVVGHGDPQVFHIGGNLVHLDFEYQYTWEKFCFLKNIPACVSFFRQEEIYPAYLKEVYTRVKDIPHEYPELTWRKEHSSRLKQEVFGSILPVEVRPKFTGHERYWTKQLVSINESIQKQTHYTYRSLLHAPLSQFLETWNYPNSQPPLELEQR